MTHDDVILEVKNLRKTFKGEKQSALNDLSFSCERGKFYGILGPDAAGKTTLMRILAGLMDFNAGMIHIFDKNIKFHTLEIQKDIGYMPQKFGLYQDLSIMENIELYSTLKDIDLGSKGRNIEKLLKATKLAPFSNRLAGDLSGGMKQKLALACTLISEPKILLLDEVSVGVDPMARMELLEIVREFLSHGTTVLWTTSYLEEARECDDILVLHEGKKVFLGNPDDFRRRTESKVFLVKTQKTQNKRDLITSILLLDTVADSTIYGDKIRVLTKEKMSKEELARQMSDISTDIEIHEMESSVEDSFVDALEVELPSFSKIANAFDRYEVTEEHAIMAHNLVRKFGSFTAVNNVDFSIKQGEIFGFLGPNGAGKSTTFKMLCGLLKPTSGEALVSNISLLDKDTSSQARNKIGYMAQKFSLYGNISVRKNLEFFSGVYGLTGKKQKEAIEKVSDAMDLNGYFKMKAGMLPLGIKQRLALACAVMHSPKVLFLDEPTSGVDPITRKEFWIHINAIVKKGVTVMVTTHFMDEAEYCDRIAIIYKGTKLIEGNPEYIKNSAFPDRETPCTFEEAFIKHIKNYDDRNI